MSNNNMMRRNWIRWGVGMSLIALVSVQSLAVMQDTVRIEEMGETQGFEELAATLTEKVASKDVDCQRALDEIENLIREIDETLEIGASDEEKLLAIRDAVAQLRLELPCLSATHLTQVPCCMPEMAPLQVVPDPALSSPVLREQIMSERVIGEQVIGEQVIAESVVDPSAFAAGSDPGAFAGGLGGAGGGGAGGGGAGGLGGGAAGGGGGGGLARLLTIGGLTGGIIAAATSGSSSSDDESSSEESL